MTTRFGWSAWTRGAVLGGSLAAGLGMMAVAPVEANASIFISVGIAPPALPVYTQPLCPGDGYIWTPGYWAYNEEGYFWVPGVWVLAPQPGYLWTPGYWGYGGNAYAWHAGYWGPHVGFYGGVNYGFGYGGNGYQGGYWRGNAFNYNRSVNNINVTNVHNTYNTTVINNNVSYNRTSYNGGQGGLQARATPGEMAAERDRHFQPTPNQLQHQQAASQNRAQFVNVNHGAPPMAAQARVGDRQNFTPARPVANAGGGNGGFRPGAGQTGGQGYNQQQRPGGQGYNQQQQQQRPGGAVQGYNQQQRPGGTAQGYNQQQRPGEAQPAPQQGRPGGVYEQQRPVVQGQQQNQWEGNREQRPGTQNAPAMQNRPAAQQRPAVQNNGGAREGGREPQGERHEGGGGGHDHR